MPAARNFLRIGLWIVGIVAAAVIAGATMTLVKIFRFMRTQPAAVELTASVRDADTIMAFVKILPGEFMMGCSAGDTECRDPEQPAHHVRITKAFELGRYEVTQAQWQSVMGSNPSIFKAQIAPSNW